ncbi:hypothetical protein [Paenibacillus xylaniclasticus]|uniref:hypothetical protein n=1 Tax=Paenibacillus xylaniclasticus TaxID=588083 RepID=UPI000FDB2B8A|nr:MULTISPECIES: hypothetical protein [Paenibacillus]GFN32546.1 hypothetical protein PCURB6_28060 [Paenibacillus curdlanolyticus]
MAVTEKMVQAWQNQYKTFHMEEVNNTYFETFRNDKYPDWQTDPKQKASWLQYKSRVGNFLDYIDKDAVTMTYDELETYIKTKPNARNHINGFYQHILKNHVLNCQ